LVRSEGKATEQGNVRKIGELKNKAGKCGVEKREEKQNVGAEL
jgi:hypothetical protein